jgi:hypothetical protein
VFILGVTDIRGFLVWLRSRCPKSLMAQMKGHTFSLPEDRCTRLLIKNLGRRMPEDVVREEMGALGTCVQGVMQLRSGRRDQNPERDRPVTSHFIVTVARGPEVSKLRSITQLCGLIVAV